MKHFDKNLPLRLLEPCAILVVLSLPFPILLNSYLIFLFFICWLLSGQWKVKTDSFLKNRYAFLMVGFYLIHIAGFFYSTNSADGLMDLEKKMSFLVFPIVFFSGFPFSDRFVFKVLHCFVASCFVASLICILYASYQWMGGDSSYFFYHKLGQILDFHAVYFSMYIGFALLFLVHSLLVQGKTFSVRKKLIYVLLQLLFIGMLILLSSKTMLVLVFFLLAYLGFSLYGFPGQTRLKVAIVTLLLAVLFFVAFMIPNVRSRFKEIVVDEYSQTNPLFLDDYAGYHFTGAAIRLAIWKTAFEIIKEQKAWLVGVGIGDTQDLLTAKYHAKHIYPGDELHEGFMHYNAHNQFIQFLLAVGLVGLIWFVIIMLVLLRIAKSRKDILLLLFVILFAGFCATESVLCRQKGIVFFTFFSCLMVANSQFKKEE
ncbi:MAG: O-antigen ligase family protein [Cytophagales bacterium]|nr:O-antigen ligase family protein [Cytophagales bacterium]MCA6369604.1 O-antigen ligase family protein [Cytophagales bacterium]MCA6370682.1 O-antigen ligase family protein [Cytophagales bacterium]MCA6374586.1 O-antigen ligase family protein [Cytophagales bacterium]MCA6383789.1 O-antigen ligase family protein [Cytophagales bacterium]